jgi:hypothetical protein
MHPINKIVSIIFCLNLLKFRWVYREGERAAKGLATCGNGSIIVGRSALLRHSNTDGCFYFLFLVMKKKQKQKPKYEK